MNITAVDFTKRLRWDFKTGLYYYCLKPDEAASIGYHCQTNVVEVRIYQAQGGSKISRHKIGLKATIHRMWKSLQAKDMEKS